MRILIPLTALALAAIAAPGQAMQVISYSEVDILGNEVDCDVDPSNVNCTVCTKDPYTGPLPVSTGSQSGRGVGVTLDPQDIANGSPYGPYTGVFYATQGCN